MTCFLTIESMLGQRVKRSERDHSEDLSVARLNYLRSVLADSKQGNLKRVCQGLSHLFQENRASLGEQAGWGGERGKEGESQFRRTEVVWERKKINSLSIPPNLKLSVHV